MAPATTQPVSNGRFPPTPPTPHRSRKLSRRLSPSRSGKTLAVLNCARPLCSPSSTSRLPAPPRRRPRHPRARSRISRISARARCSSASNRGSRCGRTSPALRLGSRWRDWDRPPQLQPRRRQGYQLTRWADDWGVTCRTRTEAEHALARAQAQSSRGRRTAGRFVPSTHRRRGACPRARCRAPPAALAQPSRNTPNARQRFRSRSRARDASSAAARAAFAWSPRINSNIAVS